MEKTDKVDDRRAQIIDAAIKRFSHFGIDKTTMSEVAEDVSISKANLYYYFPDKWSLIDAIADTAIEESNQEIQQILRNDSNKGTEYLLLRILDLKISYFQKYRLLVQDINESHMRDQRFKQMSDRMFEEERKTVAQILDLGIQSGELVTTDVGSASDLYTVIMRGLAMYCTYSFPPHTMDIGALQTVYEKQKKFIAIFVQGISKSEK